jgi:DNA repair exonuclease SbcCD nuclease subunit
MKKEINNNILVIGDIHLGRMGYSDYFSDGRQSEKKEILNFIIEQSASCNQIVFLGDVFNVKNPPSDVIKEFTEFLERLGDKEIYIIAGNHEKKSSGETALDYLREISGKNWNIITREVVKINGNVFSPYFSRTELGAENNDDAVKKLMETIGEGNILYIHHAISKTSAPTEFFNEPVLPKNELEKRFNLMVAGHIHTPFVSDKTIVTGNIFCSEVGETQRYIYKLDEDTLKVESIELPGRGIFKLTDPTDEDLKKIKKDSIVKVVLTKQLDVAQLEELKEKLNEFDAHILISDIPHERKKAHFNKDEKLLEFSIEKLLETYGEMRKIDVGKLRQGFELIK